MNGDLMPAILVVKGAKKGEWNEVGIHMVAKPPVNEGEVLVRVEACSVNRADLLQRRGFYPPPPGASHVLGLDFAGSVVEIAPDVTEWVKGDRVFGIVPAGGYGRYLAVPADNIAPIPDNLKFIEAAAAAEVFFTAYYNLFVQAEMQPHEEILLHGGGSGVGTAAIQLASNIGAEIIATVGSNDKIQRALDLGAIHVINYKKEDFAARVMEITEGRGVDIVLDWIGASYLAKHLDILKTKGRLVLIGLMGGSSGEIDLARVVTKRLKIIGSVLRSQSREEKAAIARGFVVNVVPLLATRQVEPIIDRTFPIREVEQAHLYLKRGEHFGKIVLTWESFGD
ncbi:MAG: NAD(P)H-quinone oxidoreductase [Syntrophobacteraceae bacterium]